jgi:putative intracellular protease/amidase
MLILLSLSTIASANQAPKRILMMVSEGFYAPEYYIPLKALKDAGHKITTATKYSRPINPDERQIKTYPAIIADITFKDIDYKDYDAIVFAGGNGAWEDFFPNSDVHKALTNFMSNNKVVGLLCSSTGLLGVANNLDGMSTPLAQGRNVTGYKRVKGILTELGKVNYLAGEAGKPFVVVDGNLVTGRDPISSELFAQKVIEALK